MEGGGLPKGQIPKGILQRKNVLSKTSLRAMRVLFAATESMQSLQVVRNTNGVARYVVKYIVKKDKGNRITLGANFHSGARMNNDEKFLHNTKITRSRINEEKALEKSKSRKRPSGWGIAHPNMQGRILGHSDVVTDLLFVRI